MDNLLHRKLTQVHLVVRDSCVLCTENYNKLNSFRRKDKPFQLTVINLDRGEAMPNYYGYIITPSIFINNRLWKVGELKTSDLSDKLDSFINHNLN
jgi:glutaredoxin